MTKLASLSTYSTLQH